MVEGQSAKYGKTAHSEVPITVCDFDSITDSDISEIEDGDGDVDYTVGFKPDLEKLFHPRDETDEFRVIRSSSLSGHFTLYVAGGKHKKPGQYGIGEERACPRAENQPQHCERCPFCPGQELKTPHNVLSFDSKGNVVTSGSRTDAWSVRVFPNIFPMLICPLAFYGKEHDAVLKTIPHSAVARGLHANVKVSSDPENPICHQVDALGVSEVIVENPVHNALLALESTEQISVLLRALVIRGKVLAKESWAHQLLYFKQYGPLSGGSLVHPHTQIVTLPSMSPPLLSRLEQSLQIRQSHGRCATCMIGVEPFVKRKTQKKQSVAAQDISDTADRFSDCLSPDMLEGSSRLVHITDHFVVSVPYSSGSQYSMVIAPRRHCADFLDSTQDELSDLAALLSLLAQALYVGLDDPSYNIFIRSAPSKNPVRVHGRDVYKEEMQRAFHWILEFRPRFPADLGGFEIASGVRVVSGLPEDHAAELREWVRDRIEAGVKPIASATVHNLDLPSMRASTKHSRLSRRSKSSHGNAATASRSKQAWDIPTPASDNLT